MIRVTPVAFSSVSLLAFATLALALPGHAEESLLWKSANPSGANVVPAYAGQPSPFPTTFVAPPAAPDVSAEEEAQAERQRLRDEAFSRADSLIKSGQAFQPMVTRLRVGGMLEGNLGARVLVNNQWVGKGSKVSVPKIKSLGVESALNTLSEYDETAAAELSSNLNVELSRNALIELTVQSITSSTLMLGGPGGASYPISFGLDNR